ncbi:MAG: cyclic nucleotide-binding domain-containing protein [Nitrospirae bacterium]|nr:cyclic nucleotide-binding domain-containing protein [Candidatus Troglogloeales bacterium]
MTFETFRALPFFSTFPEAILRHLYDLMEKKEYPEGFTVTREGDKGDSFFVVVSGELEVRKVINRETGEYKTLARIGEKEIFGEMAVFDQTPRSADVVSLTDVTLWRITVPYLKGLLQSDPAKGADFLMAMITLLISRLRSTSKTATVLAEAGQIVSKSPDLPTLTRALFELIVREIEGSDAAVFALYNWFNNEFNVVESTENESARTFPAVFDPSDPFVFRLTKSAEPILISGGLGYTGTISSLGTEGIFAEASSILAAPFWYGSNLFGFIVLANFLQKGAFTREHLVLLQGICNMVAPAMETFRYRSDEDARNRLLKAKGFAA